MIVPNSNGFRPVNQNIDDIVSSRDGERGRLWYFKFAEDPLLRGICLK